MCPSSGKLIVSIRHLVCHSVWMTVCCAGLDETACSVEFHSFPKTSVFTSLDETALQSHPNLHTKRSSIHSAIYQMSY
jgi:hypothetical protein